MQCQIQIQILKLKFKIENQILNPNFKTQIQILNSKLKTEIQIQNLISNFKNIYDDQGYKAILNMKDGSCVVYRVNKHFDTMMTSYVGEKSVSKKWKDVTLSGCPDHIREHILKAYKEEIRLKRERQN